MRILILIILIGLGNVCMSQVVPEDYQFFHKTQIPSLSKYNTPNEVFIDRKNNRYFISYNLSPTHVIVYNLNTHDSIGSFKIRKMAFLYESIYDSSQVYIENGIVHGRPRYYQVSLKDFSVQKVKCEEIDNGCSFGIREWSSKEILESNNEYTMTKQDDVIMVIRQNEFDIYLKETE